MDNIPTFILDVLTLIARRLLHFTQEYYLTSFKLFWRILKVGSKPYRFILKTVRERRQEQQTQSHSITPPWKSLLHRLGNRTTRRELYDQKMQSQNVCTSLEIYLYIESLDLDALRVTLDSISAQSFSKWNLSVNFSADLVEASRNQVIKLLTQKIPADNLILRAGQTFTPGSDYILYISAGDRLHPDCLYTISQFAGADLVSFDISILDANNKRQPWLRPAGISPELMVSANYLSHAAIKTNILHALADAQEIDLINCLQSDYPILLRMVNIAFGAHVHIPKILYDEGKPITNGVLRRMTAILFGEFTQIGLQDVHVEITQAGQTHITWKPDGEKVSIIIPSRDKPELIRTCLESIQEMTDYPDYEIIIVDNGSTNAETLAYYLSLSSNPAIRVIEYNEPFNYSRAINIGAAQAGGKYLLFLNNDIQIITREWLAELVQWAMLPQVGVVGAKLIYPDNTIQHAGVVFDPKLLISHVFCHQLPSASGPHGSVNWYRNYLAVTGACQMIRKDLFDSAGGYDENFGLTFNDVDICLRLIRKGYRVVYNPYSVGIHWESATRADRNPAKDILRAFATFKGVLSSGDPYYSEQLVDAFNPQLRTIEPQRNIILPLRVSQMAVRLREE